MKITKTANGNTKIKISENEWLTIGEKTKWTDKLAMGPMPPDMHLQPDDMKDSEVNSVLQLFRKMIADLNQLNNFFDTVKNKKAKLSAKIALEQIRFRAELFTNKARMQNTEI